MALIRESRIEDAARRSRIHRLAASLVGLTALLVGQTAELGAEKFGAFAHRSVGYFREVRFSPDGKYALAVDSSGVTVLNVSPFRVLYRIRANDPGDAGFTPDARQLYFLSPIVGLRGDRFQSSLLVQEVRERRWDVGRGRRISSRAVPLVGCTSFSMSPDGGTVACDDPKGDLRVFDIGRGQYVLERKHFAYPFESIISNSVDILGDPGWAVLQFSPDRRYLLAAPFAADGHPVAWNLRERGPVKLHGLLRSNNVCTFLTPKSVLVLRPARRAKSADALAKLVSFPAGKTLAERNILKGMLSRAADPNVILVRPLERFTGSARTPGPTVAAFNMSTGLYIFSQDEAIDVYGEHYLAECRSGVLGLYVVGKGLEAEVSVPRN